MTMTMLAAACWMLVSNQQITSGITPQAPVPQAASQPSTVPTLLQTAPTVAETARLQITPAMAGMIESEEWDPLVTTTDSKTFFEWEPGYIYVAGSAAVGNDLLFSLDLGANGWLVGDDNIEARVTTDSTGNPILNVRRLNAKNVAGPIWEDLKGWTLSSVVKATSSNGRIDYELKLSDAGLGILPRKNQKIAARVDLIPSQEPSLSPTQVRVLTPLALVTNRAEGLPANLHYGVERDDIAVPGDTTSVRFDFSSPKTLTQPPVKLISISGEGLMKDRLSTISTPFPPYGNKNRCFVDYKSNVALDAVSGYHILKAQLTLSDDTPATVETSFQVAPTIDVAIQHTEIPLNAQDRSIPVTMEIKSNLPKPLKGMLTFTIDPKFRVLNRSNNQEKFLLEPRGRINRKFEIYVPGNTSGTYPIEFDLDAGGIKTKIVRYITFGE